MIITKTPVRITFFGGGSDYPDYILSNRGETLGLAIDKYSTISISELPKFSDCSIELSYRHIERVKLINDISHPSVRECLKYMGIEEGIQIHYTGDLPARTGLGSSSSFTVGLLNALYAYKGQEVGAERLAREAMYVEQTLIGEKVGCQDQYTCSYGGLVNIKYHNLREIEVKKNFINEDLINGLLKNLVLVYTGIQRYADDVLKDQIVSTQNHSIDSYISQVVDLVPAGIDALESKNYDEFGRLLDVGWNLKKKFSTSITNAEIDNLYSLARQCGALGGKLLGAGGGGFFLIYINPELRDNLLNKLKMFNVINFKADNIGSRVFRI